MRRVPGIPVYWQHFLVSGIFQILLPILPILLEWWVIGRVSVKSLTLTASIFTVGIGMASQSILLLAFTVVCSISFATAYGSSVSPAGNLPASDILAIVAIVLVSAVYLIERYNFHVVDRRPFWDFSE